MTRYLVTGGHGFVGNEVVRQLCNLGHDVHVVDDMSRTAKQIEDILGVPTHNINITNGKAITALLNQIKPQYVIHLAAIHFIPDCIKHPDRTLDVNVTGTMNMLAASATSDTQKFIFASSGAVYKDSQQPLEENNSEVEPTDIYGLSKHFCEQLGRVYNSRSMEILPVRLFNVFGPRETNPHIIPEILEQLRSSRTLKLGNIDTYRDFIYVTDAARGFIELCTADTRRFDVVNLGSGHAISMRELIQLVATQMKATIEVIQDPNKLRKIDKIKQVADTTRLSELLPHFKTTPLAAGISNLLKYEKLI